MGTKSAWMLRTQFQKTEMMAEVIKMYLRGHSRHYISDRLKLSYKCVKEYIQEATEIWRNEIAMNMDEAKAKELAQIDLVACAAWDAWEKSSKPFASNSETVKDDGNGGIETTRKRERRRSNGCAAYLNVILQCSDRRCKILGLNEEQISDEAKAVVVEVVVGNREEVAKLMTYSEYKDQSFVDGQVISEEAEESSEQPLEEREDNASQ